MAETLAKSSQQSPVFIARGLAKTYLISEVEVHALRGVDLEIHEGEFIVLLGPSGSDKSTLLNILGGLDTATSGEVFWRDHNLTRVDEAALTAYRREHIGFVFQFYNLIPSLTVRENVALVTELVLHPMRPEEALQLGGDRPGSDRPHQSRAGTIDFPGFLHIRFTKNG